MTRLLNQTEMAQPTFVNWHDTENSLLLYVNDKGGTQRKDSVCLALLVKAYHSLSSHSTDQTYGHM
jgi:hypothetical protein